jgi:hypothetical protein
MASELPLLAVMTDDPAPKESRAVAVRVGAALAIVIAIGFAAWLFAFSDRSSDAATESGTKAVLASEQHLVDIATQAHHPVYWAGPIAGTSYELTTTNDGRIYVRYLPDGVQVGDPRPIFTTIGTYPEANAYRALKRTSRRSGARAVDTTRGALVVTNPKTSASVYFAFKNSPYLVEVFNPSAGKALQLTLSGQIRPIR